MGLSPTAKHYYVTVSEQENCWWDESENAWRELDDDAEKSGYELNKGNVMTLKEAVELAVFFIKLIHPKDYKEQEINWDGNGKPKWIKNF